MAEIEIKRRPLAEILDRLAAAAISYAGQLDAIMTGREASHGLCEYARRVKADTLRQSTAWRDVARRIREP